VDVNHHHHLMEQVEEVSLVEIAMSKVNHLHQFMKRCVLFVDLMGIGLLQWLCTIGSTQLGWRNVRALFLPKHFLLFNYMIMLIIKKCLRKVPSFGEVP
jgi:hypothetical protein